ncbi:hypothetical protein QBA37_34930 [Streptomyces silvae]|uniref:Uncharacterized protein n=1 Tax=Streptomyces silvae TaxID=2803812 RepID=A0ABU8ADB3_9ACTN
MAQAATTPEQRGQGVVAARAAFDHGLTVAAKPRQGTKDRKAYASYDALTIPPDPHARQRSREERSRKIINRAKNGENKK